MFTSKVQFDHAGSHTDNDHETAVTKSKALREADAYAPNSFNELRGLTK
jgi:ATP citrate (pro-S)-lyase